MADTNQGLSKTILFLTKTIFTFLIVSILIYLNFIDLQENNNNRTYLNVLKDISEKYGRSELQFKDFELKRLDSLKVIDPALYKRHYESRVALVKILNNYGAFITRASKGGNESKDNIIVLMIDDSIRSNIKNNIERPKLTRNRKMLN